MDKTYYISRFDANILALFRSAVRVSLKRPRRALFFARAFLWQRRHERVRRWWRGRNVDVPPVMIISVTDRCNFNCHGCYARVLRPVPRGEMDTRTLTRVVGEASELGIGIIMFAGGEPLLRRDLFEVAASFPDTIFVMFTNGSLLDERVVADVVRHPNLIAALSLEGEEGETDGRRGQRTHERVWDAMEMLRDAGVFFGTSFTVNRFTLDTVTDDGFIRTVMARGAGVVFFVEYVPIDGATRDWALTANQKEYLTRTADYFSRRYPGLFLAFPGNEEQYGGCLAAGRGFIHVNASGVVEPCPFAPFAAADLSETSLRDALAAPLLKTLAANREKLGETVGGCALWTNRDWVAEIAARGRTSGSEDVIIH